MWIFRSQYFSGDVQGGRSELPELLKERRPQALLDVRACDAVPPMSGLRPAPATPSRCCGPTPRRRACARARSPWPDALRFGPHTAKLLRAALVTRHRRAALARCRRLFLQLSELARAIESVGPLTYDLKLAAFVHVPLLARDGTSRRKGSSPVTLEELVHAGEAMLLEMVQLARQAVRENSRAS